MYPRPWTHNVCGVLSRKYVHVIAPSLLHLTHIEPLSATEIIRRTCYYLLLLFSWPPLYGQMSAWNSIIPNNTNNNTVRLVLFYYILYMYCFRSTLIWWFNNFTEIWHYLTQCARICCIKRECHPSPTLQLSLGFTALSLHKVPWHLFR